VQVPAARRAVRVYAAGQKLEYIWTDGQEGKEIKVSDGCMRSREARRLRLTPAEPPAPTPLDPHSPSVINPPPAPHIHSPTRA